MDWTEETVARLRELWTQGLSTAEIGRQLGITKNAVVGKAHRLNLSGRPSPIRRDGAAASPRAAKASKTADAAVSAGEGATTEAPTAETAGIALSAPVATARVEATPVVAPKLMEEIAAPVRVTQAAAPVAAAPVRDDSAALVELIAKPVKPVSSIPAAPRPALRSVTSTPEPKRRGLSCCWPLGDPGSPGFHFCGATPLTGKPYCSSHAQLAYVKLRDRRDSVA